MPSQAVMKIIDDIDQREADYDRISHQHHMAEVARCGTGRTVCGRCHKCGMPLKIVLDGEEWCVKCHAYRRYRSHGWADEAAA